MASEITGLVGQFGQVKRALQDHGSFLPATMEEPPEEPQPPDVDKMEDNANFDEANLCFNAESVIEPDRPYIYPGAPLPRVECNFFRQFIDGSIRTYYLGEQIEGNRAYPVMATEVATAVIQREEDGHPRVQSFRRRIALLVPSCPPVSDDTWKDLLKLKGSFDRSSFKYRLEVVPLEREEQHEGVDLRTSLAGKARSIMHDLEYDSAMELDRSDDDWLILDGAIRKTKFLRLKNAIGLAKSFSRKPVFSIEGRKVRDVVSLLSALKEGHRTIVFKRKIQRGEAEDPVKRGVSFWYLRLRSGKGLQGPLQGIVKIDLHLPYASLENKHIEQVNLISRALMAEKYVSPYPTPRWHAHIYPIYVAETYIKSSMLTPVVFRGYFG